MTEPAEQAASFRDRVATVLDTLGPGDIVSYGEVAAAAGSAGAARAVGRILRELDDAPWWRVVRGDGRLAAPDLAEQTRRLAAEGVAVRGGRAVPPTLRGSGTPSPSGAGRS